MKSTGFVFGLCAVSLHSAPFTFAGSPWQWTHDASGTVTVQFLGESPISDSDTTTSPTDSSISASVNVTQGQLNNTLSGGVGSSASGSTPTALQLHHRLEFDYSNLTPTTPSGEVSVTGNLSAVFEFVMPVNQVDLQYELRLERLPLGAPPIASTATIQLDNVTQGVPLLTLTSPIGVTTTTLVANPLDVMRLTVLINANGTIPAGLTELTRENWRFFMDFSIPPCPDGMPEDCGDGCCTGAETCSSCPFDCLISCGDGCCELDEECTCPQDCDRLGTCCESMGPACADKVLESQCTGEFRACATCAALIPSCGSGACCPADGGCMENQLPGTCQPPSVFHSGLLCNELDPPCPQPGCGPCRLHTDLTEYFCIGDIGDLIEQLAGFAEAVQCTRQSESGLTPGSVVWDGGCWVTCETDADCVSALGPGKCVGGQCCDICDLADIMAKLDAFQFDWSCPHACPPGACEIVTAAFPAGCCRDQFYFDSFSGANQGTSETDCYLAGGVYLGDNVRCSTGSALPVCNAP